ncbi:MAG: hypothetical protein ACYS8W_04635 [Planctomycetota bacterium]
MIDRFSGLLGLFAFFLASATGLLMGKSAENVLFTSLVAMVSFVILGKVVGFMVKRIVAEVVAEMPEEDLAGIEAEELVEGKAAVLGEPDELEESAPPLPAGTPVPQSAEEGEAKTENGEEDQTGQNGGAVTAA